MHPPASDPPANDEERLQLAWNTARRVVAQCHRHAENVTGRLSGRISGAPAGTPCGDDLAAARLRSHRIAFEEHMRNMQSMSNALVSHLHGLDVLITHEPFLALPTIPILRALAEVAATTSWMLTPGLSGDERAARGYASLFRTLEQNRTHMERADEFRERLVKEITQNGGRIQRRVVRGEATDAIGTVHVGRAHAKTAFKYQQRLQTQIPAIGSMYPGMSALVHGEGAALGLAWDWTAVTLRMIAKVALESTRAWSNAVHVWTGTELIRPFVNPVDEENIIRSMPPEQIAEFEAERQKAAQPSAGS